VWNLFMTSVLQATGAIVNNAGLVKKVSFPREILALASVGSSAVFFFFQSIVLVIFLASLHWSPAYGLLWLLIVGFIPLVVFCSAMAIFLAAVNVYLRDTQHLVEVVVGSAWFWACPIVYSFQRTVLPKLIQHHFPVWIYLINPLTPIVLTFERVIYARTGLVHLTLPGSLHAQLLPGWGPMTYVQFDAIVLVVSLLLLYGAMVVFGRLAGNFAEEL
ncbi:MAG: ABC transporter permease, partial [Acidimicrobiales bacterium]